jgi:outer membrane protein OmpA-like peptidoglycan-associated protein
VEAAAPPPPLPAAQPPAPPKAESAEKPTPKPATPPPQGTPEVQAVYTPDGTAIPDATKPALETLATRMKADTNLRLTVVAHASGTADQVSVARRVSLARALAVRAYLIDQGVDNLRINVQAEGNKDAGTPADRVDVFALTGK